ncbi:ligand-binding sensor domain-containing protein [Pedobacter roseus]|uniref:Histidine kinase n=1 Tax=Pedobacter roseus TaxID=336820 RepID=A0A7G9Q9Z3_9SPHI|nr:two-component regulator propeller domain-containing protein [Pedobacter roseus]QNN40168.1 histidine kinase [Pedobacter roseus]
MKNKRNVLYSLMITLAGVSYFPVQAQQKNGTQDTNETKNVSSSHSPNSIVRAIKQDRKGNIWLTSGEGVFKYDGKSFTNITSKVSSARFFAVLEDRKGNFWFATIGSGVYYYNGKSFHNFTTKDGLASDRVGNIYEDKTGNIWFGTENGASRYNGKSFRNFKMNDSAPATQADSVHVSAYQHPLPKDSWMHNDVNAIIEDKTGKLWFGTRGYISVYDGKTFTTITNKDGKAFANVRSILEDKKGNIWIGGSDGLWRYNGNTFTNFTQKFVGYVYEDKKGNIWTSSESGNGQGWALSRYDGKSLSDKKTIVTEIINKPMIFGILEGNDGNIWFGANGLYRYDGKTITDFKSEEGRKH